MSVRVMADVWEHSEMEGGALLVLLALADWANDEGKCWPRAETLAKKARLSTRQLSRVLTSLEDAGEITVPPGPRSEERPYQIRQNVVTTPTSVPDQTPVSDPVRAQDNAVFQPPIEPPQGLLLPDPVETAWEHYVTKLDRPRAQLTRKVRKWLADATESCGLDLVLKAIDGLAASDYHRQNGYVGIEYAIKPRQDETLEGRLTFMAAKASGVMQQSDGPLKLSERLATLPTEQREFMEARVANLRQAVSRGERNEHAEALVRDKLHAEPVIEGLCVVGWSHVA